MIAAFFCSGCSYTLFKREGNVNDPKDAGSEVNIKVRGPGVAVQNKF